jgi:hypothetical protein
MEEAAESTLNTSPAFTQTLSEGREVRRRKNRRKDGDGKVRKGVYEKKEEEKWWERGGRRLEK